MDFSDNSSRFYKISRLLLMLKMIKCNLALFGYTYPSPSQLRYFVNFVGKKVDQNYLDSVSCIVFFFSSLVKILQEKIWW